MATVIIGGQEVPTEKAWDVLYGLVSRGEDLRIAELKAISQLSDAVRLLAGKPAASPPNLRQQLETGQLVPYFVKMFDMTTAQNDLPYPVPGEADNVVFASDGSLSGVFVKFNNKDQDSPVPVQYLNYRTKLYTLYLTWPAQVGKTLWVATGSSGVAEPLLRTGSPTPISGGIQTIYNAMPAGVGDFYSTMVDMRASNRLLLFAVSTLDQAISLQVIGNYADSTLLTTDIDGAVPMAIGSVTTQTASVGLAFDDWHPFVGVRITTTIACAAGTLAIYAIAQE